MPNRVPSGVPAGRCRVVVAEDEPMIRGAIVELLSAEHDVAGVAEDGQQLIVLVREHQPHLAVVDIGMPRMNGFEALRFLRTERLEVKVIFCTTNSSPLYVRKALEAGVNGYLLKAFLCEEMPTAIRVVLAGGTFLSPSLLAQ